MRPFETLRASDGYQVCLFPLEYMNISQDENGGYSHQGTYNIDFLGWSAIGRLLNCPYYAPVDLKCVDGSSVADNNRIYESLDPVHLADGTIDYLTILVAHDNNPPHNIGDIVRQGQLLGRTGTAGQVTGDHVHSCCGKGRYQGITTRPTGHIDLTNRCHYWEATYVNDTTIINGENHDWKIWNGGSPSFHRKAKFPFVLYANKLRNMYRKN